MGCSLTARAEIRTRVRGFVAMCAKHYTTEANNSMAAPVVPKQSPTQVFTDSMLLILLDRKRSGTLMVYVYLSRIGECVHEMDIF